MHDSGSRMRLYFALWALFYSLLQGLGCLRPNFIHRFHGQSVRLQRRIHDDFDVTAVVEIVVAMICFLHSRQCFPTKEVIHKIRQVVNQEEEARRYFYLRDVFTLELYKAEEILDKWKEEIKSLGERFLDLSLDESERGAAKDKLDKLSDASKDLEKVYDELLGLHATREEISNEPFCGNFFSTTFEENPQMQAFFAHIRQKSISMAVRSSNDYRWRFNRTRKMQTFAISCMPAILLISEYEKFLLETSPCGKMHWAFESVKAVILKYNNRTLDISKYSNVVRTSSEKDIAADDNDFDDPTWGLNKTTKGRKEKLPGPPIKAKRKFGEDRQARAEMLFSKDKESDIPTQYVTWCSENMTEDVLSFFDVRVGDKYREKQR